MVDFILNFVDAFNGEGRFLADIRKFFRGNFTLVVPVFARGYFNVAPDLKLALQRPQAAYFGGGISFDHVSPIREKYAHPLG